VTTIGAHKTRCGSAESKRLSIQHWQRKVGCRRTRAGMSPSWRRRWTRTHRTLNTYYNGFGGGWRWRGGLGEATTTEYTCRVGTLVVLLFDSNTKQLIWRGSLMDALTDKSDKNIKKLDNGVEKMFVHFPPEAHKG
jgi:hypothetical protein